MVRALGRLGALLDATADPPSMELFLIGGGAGLLTGTLDPKVTTVDCDVMDVLPHEAWNSIKDAASAVASELGLAENWLNRESRIFGHLVPLGWKRRCKRIGTFGPLTVHAICRKDLIACKVMAAVKRPADRELLIGLKLTADEIAFARANIQRVANESADRNTFDDELAILDALEQSR